MTVQEAVETINKIKNFSASIENREKTTIIVVEYFFKGKKKEAGFLSEKDTKLSIGFCGSFTDSYESKLNHIKSFKIGWKQETTQETQQPQKQHKKQHLRRIRIESYHYSSLSERDRLESDSSNWMYTHDL